VAKYWKQVMRVEILSEGERPPVFDDLKDVHEAITRGDCSGVVENIMSTPLSREDCADALLEQASDPGFLIADWVDPDV
jgi:hypothetical protein